MLLMGLTADKNRAVSIRVFLRSLFKDMPGVEVGVSGDLFEVSCPYSAGISFRKIREMIQSCGRDYIRSLVEDSRWDDEKCKESGCPGSISANNFVLLPLAGCASSNMGFPCSDCGRIYYWLNTEPRLSTDGKKLFWVDNKVIKKDPALAV